MIHKIRHFCAALAALLLCGAAAAAEVNLYTDRQAVFLKPVLAAFEAETGIKTNVLFAKKGLLERMQAEGENSPADVVMAVDVAVLQDFTDAGLLAPHGDSGIAAAVLPGYADKHWVAVTRRARILFVPAAAGGGGIDTYEALAAPENRGKVCLRSGKNKYNIGLIADMISRHGEAKAKAWLVGVKQNLARKPQGKDRAQIYDVAAGVCGIGIANSYYYFQLLKNADKRDQIKNARLVIPKQAHINVTGAALAAHAPNRDNALRLMRFLVSKQGQEIYVKENGEFPVRDDVALTSELKPYAEALLRQAAPLAQIARYRAAASRLVEALAFDQ